MANPFVHVELSTTDPAKAKSFYGQLFDWKLEDMQMGPDMTYTLIDPSGGTGGGMMKQICADVPSAWMPYVIVDDVAAATKKAAGKPQDRLRHPTHRPTAGRARTSRTEPD